MRADVLNASYVKDAVAAGFVKTLNITVTFGTESDNWLVLLLMGR